MKSNNSLMKCVLTVLENSIKESFALTARTAEAIAAAIFQVEYRGMGFIKNTSKQDKYSLVYEGVELTSYSESGVNSYDIFSDFGWSRSKIYRVLGIATPSMTRQEFEKLRSLPRDQWFIDSEGRVCPYIRVRNRLKHTTTWVRNHQWWEELAKKAKNIKQLTDFNSLVAKILEEGKKVIKKVKDTVETAVDTVVETFDNIKETISDKIAQFTVSPQTEVIETEIETEETEIETEGLTSISELEQSIKIAPPEERYPNRSELPELLENEEKHNIIKKISGYLLKPETLRCSSDIQFISGEQFIFLDLLTSITQTEFPKLSASQSRDYATKNTEAIINNNEKHPYYKKTIQAYSIFKIIHILLAAAVKEPYDYLDKLSVDIFKLTDKTLRGYVDGTFDGLLS